MMFVSMLPFPLMMATIIRSILRSLDQGSTFNVKYLLDVHRTISKTMFNRRNI